MVSITTEDVMLIEDTITMPFALSSASTSPTYCAYTILFSGHREVCLESLRLLVRYTQEFVKGLPLNKITNKTVYSIPCL